jgi:hypothetical protein
LFVRCIADVVGETLIVDASSQNHAPDAEGGKDGSRDLGPFKLASNSRIMDLT